MPSIAVVLLNLTGSEEGFCCKKNAFIIRIIVSEIKYGYSCCLKMRNAEVFESRTVGQVNVTSLENILKYHYGS